MAMGNKVGLYKEIVEYEKRCLMDEIEAFFSGSGAYYDRFRGTSSDPSGLLQRATEFCGFNDYDKPPIEVLYERLRYNMFNDLRIKFRYIIRKYQQLDRLDFYEAEPSYIQYDYRSQVEMNLSGSEPNNTTFEVEEYIGQDGRRMRRAVEMGRDGRPIRRAVETEAAFQREVDKEIYSEDLGEYEWSQYPSDNVKIWGQKTVSPVKKKENLLDDDLFEI